MLRAALLGSYICSFDTWWYYISIFIRFIYIGKHIPFHCLNQFHLPKSQERLGNCIYLCSGYCDAPPVPLQEWRNYYSSNWERHPSRCPQGLPRLKRTASSPRPWPVGSDLSSVTDWYGDRGSCPSSGQLWSVTLELLSRAGPGIPPIQHRNSTPPSSHSLLLLPHLPT